MPDKEPGIPLPDERKIWPQPADETPRTPRSQQAATEVGLPALVGMPEEIGQALEIRSDILMQADDYMTQLRANQILTEEQSDTAVVPDQPVTHEQVLAAQAALNRLRHQTDANWWIAHQQDDVVSLLSMI
ncbi:MAG TPA: hypothetical protein VFA07_02630 [Chthonomonadaceae bacterium]|nr:hypothetical protein [Chthonomonadaceae bacterium]